jgi:hypothetical protein
VNRVAAEIAEEIRVLLQHHNENAGSRQQKSKHHSGRATASDAALRCNSCISHVRPTFFRPLVGNRVGQG